jgi:hypothetical protein
MAGSDTGRWGVKNSRGLDTFYFKPKVALVYYCTGNKTKKWNSTFAIVSVPFKFQQN